MSLSEKTKRYLQKHVSLDLTGKHVLITGGNSGIGYQTAEIMLHQGARVILACRHTERAAAAQAALLADYPGASVSVMSVDLGSRESIWRFAEALREQAVDVDVFIHNAGVFRQPGRRTADGFELVMGTNYLGAYCLAEAVLPYLATLSHPVTYLNTVSLVHRMARLDYADFYGERHYGNFRIYARSKLALAIYTQALAKQYGGTSVTVGMIHPGVSITPLGRKAYGEGIYRAADALKFLFNPAEKSALGAVYFLTQVNEPGCVVGPRGLGHVWGLPGREKPSPRTLVGSDELLRFTREQLGEKGFCSATR